MPLSKSTRIIILLAIDSAFFLLELLVGKAITNHRPLVRIDCLPGYGVHSLALVADSFHMVSTAATLLEKCALTIIPL